MIKDEWRLLSDKYWPLTLFVTFACERELLIEQNCNILTPTLMAVSVVSFSFYWCSIGGPETHPLLSDGFLYCISSATSLDPNSVRSLTQLSWLLSWLSYIIVQRPLNCLLDLWNRMLDRCLAEITVMQFRGHSLPVRQSMSVPWEFFTSSHFISQFPPTRFPLVTAIRLCHFLPVHHLEWHFW